MTDWKARLAEVNHAPSKLVIGNLNPGGVSASFQRSMQGTVLADLAGSRRLVDTAPGRLGVALNHTGGGQIARGRNAMTAAFLDGNPAADLLLFVDSDMGWPPDAVEFLASLMDDTGLPIVGGLCFGAKQLRFDETGAPETEWFPTLYAWNTVGDEVGYDTLYDYPADALIQVAATGAAFLMISRACLDAIREAEGDNWFTPVQPEGAKQPFGEDVSFCWRADRHGFPTHVHTGVKTSHHKDVWITEEVYRDLRSPAASAVTVVIPVKDNLAMTRDLVGQLVGQGGISDILIFDNGSTDPVMREWLEGQSVATVFSSPDAGIHEMWNAGIDEAIARHHGLADVVLLNNDVALGPGCVRRLVAGLRSENGVMAACPNYDGRPGTGVSPLRSICANRYDGSGGLAGFAFALRAEWIASGYRFPTAMKWWYGDNDLCLSIEKAGGWYGMVHAAKCIHLDGGSQTPTPDGWDAQIAADREAFEAKWPTVTLTAA